MRFIGRSRLMPGWLGVEIADDQIRVAHATARVGEKPLVSFQSAEAGSDGAVLQRLARQCHLQRYRCTTLLRPNEYQMLLVDAPNVPAPEIKTAVRWRLKDMLDYHIDDATIDVIGIPKDKDGAAGNKALFAVAARNSLIKTRVDQFDEAKIPLTVIDIPEMAQRNIAARIEEPDRGIALLAFATDHGLLTISANGELFSSRRIDIAWDQIALARGDARNDLFDRITLEIQRSLDHFDRQFPFVAINKLVLAPGADGNGLGDYLGKNLYLPVDTLDLAAVFDLSKTPELTDITRQRQFFHVLGATLRYEDKAL